MLRLKLVTPVLMWSIVGIGAILSMWLLPEEHLFRGAPIVLLLAAVIWVAVLLASFAQHREAPRSAAAVPRIVTTGPYRYVRHPMYAVDVLLAISLGAGFPRIDVLVASAFAIIIFLVWMRLEERALLQRFGDTYQEYRKRTPMLFPRLR